MTLKKRLRPSLLAGALTVVALSVILSGSAWGLLGSPDDETADRVLSAIDSSRVTTLELDGAEVYVTGTAAAVPGDATRTLWYETLAGSAYAQAMKAWAVERVVIDDKGITIATEVDTVYALSTDALGPPTVSAAEIESHTADIAATLDATIVEVHYVALFGGGAELVVQPRDLAGFTASAGENVNALLGKLGSQPYLVTIVDEAGAAQLILGFVPGVGGDNGQGIAWIAPGVTSDAVIGQPVVLPEAS